MIVRPARGAHICLRCQRANRANASTSRRASQSSDSKRQVVRRVVDADVDYNVNHNFTRGLGNALDYKAFRNGVGGGLHGHRGLQVQENREPLNTTTLGDPADVLVLRDSILTLYAAGGSRNVEVMEPEHIDILSRLKEEKGLVGQKEVESNIDAFRPANELQSWEDINELVREIQDGFTMPQLQMYIRNFEGRQDPQRQPQEWAIVKEDAKILRVTPWLPGVSEVREYFDNDPLRGYFLPSHTVKQRVVMQLLRECWMLELPELADGIGQFEIELREEDLELLLMGNMSVLDHIHSEHLQQENEKLEAFRKRSVIRITGPRVKKPFIVQEVEAALQRVRREIVALGSLAPQGREKIKQGGNRWDRKNFGSKTIQVLERLTNTSIVQQRNGELVISCIDTTPNALVSAIDVARRLLLTSSKAPDRVEHLVVGEKPKLKEGAFIRHEVGNTLPWRDRLREWARWTAPTGKEAADISAIPTEPVFVSKPLPRKEQGNSEADTDVASAYARTHWNHEYFTETSAILGKVLHSRLNPDSPPVPLELGGPNQTTTFSTQFSNLSQVLGKSQARLEGRTDQIVLRFLPNPFVTASHLRKSTYPASKPTKTRPIGSEALSAFPTIEMWFDINSENKHATLIEVQAIVRESRTDVLLPHTNTDIRFQQRTTSCLLGTSIQPVREYLQKSNLSLKGSDILQTPPSIRIPIEKHLCHGLGFKLLDTIDPNGKRIANTNVRDVEYLFAGLEMRSELSFEYKKWRLVYTSIEAGKAGGQRAELKLRNILGGEVAKESEFVKVAYELASQIGDQDPQNSIPEVLRKTRRVGNTVAPKVVRRTPTPGPSFEQLTHIARRVNLTSDPSGDRRESKGLGREEMGLDKQSEDVASEANNQAKKVEQARLDDERAMEKMAKELKNIEDDGI